MSPYKIPQHHKKLMPGHTLEERYDLLAEAVNEMSGDCDERCVDGYHDDNCQALDSHFTIIQQQKRIAELAADNDTLRQAYARSLDKSAELEAELTNQHKEWSAHSEVLAQQRDEALVDNKRLWAVEKHARALLDGGGDEAVHHLRNALKESEG